MQTALLVTVTLTWLVNAADDASPKKDVEIIEPKTRSLYVRNIPGIFGHGSNLYGSPVRPFHFVSTIPETRSASMSLLNDRH
jgi:hypothetical protein